MNQYYLDALRFDQDASIATSEFRTIIGTGLNRRTIKKLARTIMGKLMGDVAALPHDWNENDFVQKHMDDIIAIQGIMSFYRKITGISDREPGGKEVFLRELWLAIHNDNRLDRKKKGLLYSFLSEDARILTSMEMVGRLRESTHRPTFATPGESNALSTIRVLTGHEQLVCIQASVIARYLQAMSSHSNPTGVSA